MIDWDGVEKAQKEIELLRGLLRNEAHGLVLACEAYRITQLVGSVKDPLIKGDWAYIRDKADALDKALRDNGILDDEEEAE